MKQQEVIRIRERIKDELEGATTQLIALKDDGFLLRVKVDGDERIIDNESSFDRYLQQRTVFALGGWTYQDGGWKPGP